MARPNQQNVNQREVINTIEDTSKYQTGFSRRLRVSADPLRIESTPEPSKVAGLAAALSSIEPTLMNFAINKQAEAYKTSIEVGKRKAQTGEVTQSEMEQFGYDNVKAVNDWTDFNQRVTKEYDQNFDKENGNLDEFLKAQWESNDFNDKSNDYMAKFNPLAGKTLEKLRQAHGEFKAGQQALQNDVELIRLFSADIQDTMGSGLDYDITQYESRREGLKAMLPGKTNTQLDELAYQAVLEVMQETGDTSLASVFTKPHADGTPGLYEIPAWKKRIDTDLRQVEAESVAKANKLNTENEKALKNASETIERDILFTLIDVNEMPDGEEKDAELRALITTADEYSSKGIPISNATIKTLMSASKGFDKESETKAQEANYVRLRLGNPSASQIASEFNSGNISKSGFDKLMTKRDTAAKAGGSEKPLTSNPFVKEMAKIIRAESGYSFASMDTNNEQMKQNANAVTEKALEYVEEQIGSGVPVKEATSKATEWAIKRMKEAGINSKGLDDARSKVDAVELKQKNPVEYYKKDLRAFTQDSINNTLPKIPPKELLKLQSEAKKQAIANKKLKRHESTK